MGVDTAAAGDWLAHYGSGLGLRLRRRRAAPGRPRGAGHPRRGHLPRARAGRRDLAGHVPGRTPSKGLEVVWPALHAYNRWLAEFCAAAPGRRAGVPPDRPARHGPRRAGDRLGPRRRHSSAGSCCRRCRSAAGCRATPTTTTSRCGAPARTTAWWSTSTPARRATATDAKLPLRREARGVPRPLRGLRLHPPAALVHDLRRRLRPAPGPAGGRDRERRAVAAVAGPGHGVLLRHPRWGPGPLLSAAPTLRVRRAPRVPGGLAHEALRGRDARGDRRGPPHVGRRLSPPGGGGARPPPGAAPRLRWAARRGPATHPRAERRRAVRVRPRPAGGGGRPGRARRSRTSPPAWRWRTSPRRSSWSLARPVPLVSTSATPT